MKPSGKGVALLGFITIFDAFFIQKAAPPFTDIGLFIFSLPLLDSLRSYPKMAIYFPAILSFFAAACFKILIARTQNGSSKVYAMIVIILVFITLLYPLPFLTGKFQQDMSENDRSNYSYLVKIPDYYYLLFNHLNNQSGDFKCVYLPLGEVIGIGWSAYPEWGYFGYDITTFLSKKSIIPSWFLLNVFDISYNYNDYPKESLPKLLGMLNVKYILLNEDTGYQYINNIKNELKYMIDRHIINHIRNFGNIKIYELSDEYYIPHIYPAKHIIFINGTKTNMIYFLGENNNFNNSSVCILASDLNSDNFLYSKIMKFNDHNIYSHYYNDNIFLSNITMLKPVLSLSNENVSLIYNRINPTKYSVSINNATEPFLLVLSESYHPFWKAYANDSDTSNRTFDIRDIKYLFYDPLQEDFHFKVNAYANGWYIDPKDITNNGNISITLNFLPQSIFYLGIIVSILTLVLCLCYLCYRSYNHKLL
jgi:hypothetical protein